MPFADHTPKYLKEYNAYLIEDVIYRKTPEKDLPLDIMYPAERSEHPRPIFIWIHGGGYNGGDQKMTDICYEAVKAGYLVVSLEYRLSFYARFPALLIDCKAGVRWVRAHAGELGGDPAHIGVCGGSAGGHLAALVGTCGDLPIYAEGDHLDVSGKVQAVCDMFGPINFNTMPEVYHKQGSMPLVQLVGGLLAERQELVRAANPVTYIHEHLPPFYIAHGIQDDNVTINQSEELYEALRAAGYEPDFLRVNNARHVFIPINGFQVTDPPINEINAAVIGFFDKHLKK